jgi:hypothetical protein
VGSVRGDKLGQQWHTLPAKYPIIMGRDEIKVIK